MAYLASFRSRQKVPLPPHRGWLGFASGGNAQLQQNGPHKVTQRLVGPLAVHLATTMNRIVLVLPTDSNVECNKGVN